MSTNEYTTTKGCPRMCDDIEFTFLYVTTEMANNYCQKSDRYLDLKSDQWALAEELLKVLSPFEVATTYFGIEENCFYLFRSPNFVRYVGQYQIFSQ